MVLEISQASFTPSVQPASFRHLLVQLLYVHISSWSYQIQSGSRGYNWWKAVERYWNPALENICETCHPKLFKEKIARKVSRKYHFEIGDIIQNIKNYDCLWSPLFFNHDFGAVVTSRVQTWQPTRDMRLAPCTCRQYTHAPTLRYGHPTQHQYTFVMPTR